MLDKAFKSCRVCRCPFDLSQMQDQDARAKLQAGLGLLHMGDLQTSSIKLIIANVPEYDQSMRPARALHAAT